MRHCQQGKVLDVGCSTGGFLHRLETLKPGVYDRIGTDIAGNALAVARTNGVPVIDQDFFSPDFPDRDFDAITFWAVLEHLESPRQFIQRAHELLKPTGLLFFVVPNAQSLALRLLGSKYRYVLPEHLNYFTQKTACQLLRPGFHPVQITTSHFNPFVIIQDFFRRSPPPREERAKLLNQTNRLKGSKLLAPVRLVYNAAELTLRAAGLADNIIGCAVKKL